MIKHLNIYKCFQSELHLKQQVHFVHSRGVNLTHKFQALLSGKSIKHHLLFFLHFYESTENL
jgi:hypothetical protein